MNASGEKWQVTIGSSTYWFDECKIVCAGKITDTPLIGGGVYRCRTLPGIYELTFKLREPHSKLDDCCSLLATSAASGCTISIGQTSFGSCMLRSGGFKAQEGDERAYFEITFTGVSS